MNGLSADVAGLGGVSVSEKYLMKTIIKIHKFLIVEMK